MNSQGIAEAALEQGDGILWLGKPTWVPRSFCTPARNLKLHDDDYFPWGPAFGGIDERWFASTIETKNDPKTSSVEGLSHVTMKNGGRIMEITLAEVVDLLGAHIVGDVLWGKYEDWPMYSKFFDNLEPLPHHIHHRGKHAAQTGQAGKPEAYFFPPQMNSVHRGDRGMTHFGLIPGTTKGEVRSRLEMFADGGRDNRLVNLAPAYWLEPGTGWDVPAGILHAPGSMCTYELQFRSDVFAMYQSVIENRTMVPQDLLWNNCPPELKGTRKGMDWLMDVIDWDANVDPLFVKNHFMKPKFVEDFDEKKLMGYEDRWIVWRSPHYSAKELTVLPGATVNVYDNAPYGFIMMQGNGTIQRKGVNQKVLSIETPSMIRLGQLTKDEYFVCDDTAQHGVTIHNRSDIDPIVMLKHFAGGNPDLPAEYITAPMSA
jgi:hypothetical protein